MDLALPYRDLRCVVTSALSKSRKNPLLQGTHVWEGQSHLLCRGLGLSEHGFVEGRCHFLALEGGGEGSLSAGCSEAEGVLSPQEDQGVDMKVAWNDCAFYFHEC